MFSRVADVCVFVQVKGKRKGDNKGKIILKKYSNCNWKPTCRAEICNFMTAEQLRQKVCACWSVCVGGEGGRISINLLHYCSHFHSLHHQSMCSLRFKIFKSVICQHYEVNARPRDWCPIRHYAFHLTWPPHISQGPDMAFCSSGWKRLCTRCL